MKKILTEAQIKLTDLKANRWNDAYFASAQEIKTKTGYALYRIKLTTSDKDDAKNVLKPNDYSRGSNTKYLKLDLNSSAVHTPINKAWLRQNINTANFSFSRSEGDATLFELPASNAAASDEGKELTKALRNRKARRALAYTTAELERVEDRNEQNLSKNDEEGILSSSGESVSFDKTTLIKLYLTALFNKINTTDKGDSLYDEYACSGSDISADANSFYSKYLSSDANREVILDRVKAPLFGNGILTIAAFLFAHGNTSSDLLTRALQLNNALDRSTYDAGVGRLCSGETFILATNANFKNFDPTEFSQTIQLSYNLLNSNGGNDVKNSRARLSSKDKSLAKALVAYLVADASNFEADQYETMKNYLLGTNGVENINSSLVASLCNADLSKVSLKSYDNIKSEAQLILLKDTGDVKDLYITVIAVSKEASEEDKRKNSSIMNQEWGSLYSVSNVNKISKALTLYTYAKGKGEVIISFSHDSRFKNIVSIESVEGLDGAILERGKVKIAVKGWKAETVNTLVENLTFDTSTGTLSFDGVTISKDEEESDNPWTEWDKEHPQGTWDKVAEENSTEEKEG